MDSKLRLQKYKGIVSMGAGKTEEIVVDALDRASAVGAIYKIFWTTPHMRGLGPAKLILVVDDPLEEAQFVDGMNCPNALYKLLPQEAIDRIVKDSKGEIGANTDPNSHCSLKRLKKKKAKDSPTTDRAQETQGAVKNTMPAETGCKTLAKPGGVWGGSNIIGTEPASRRKVEVTFNGFPEGRRPVPLGYSRRSGGRNVLATG